jgi:hypothetical protein
MHAVVRTYSGKGAKELFDILEKSKAHVEQAMRRVKGLISYSLVRTSDGGFSVSVCQDRIGTDESVLVAWEWIAKNASGPGAAPPNVTEGTIITHLN